MPEDVVNHKIKFSAAGVLVTLGIVFGDIGTSPLYVVKASISEGFPIEENFILGILSCVIWTLTLQTTIKYVLITLKADNKGEGGIFSLFALLRKNKRGLYILAIIGGSTLLADGIITPSITVISSIEGLTFINSEIRVVPIVLIILTILFSIQQFGTEYVGKFFGPVMLIWFVMLSILGILEIGQNSQVLKAFNPYYAIFLLSQYPGSILLLGAVFLCTTGAEALYADLGHCGLKNIRVSWTFVKSALILNYLGQGGWVLRNSSNLTDNSNPFYGMMPSWFLPFGIIIATAAAIVASQALITGSFTLISEAISLNFWPKLRIKYPTLQKGQMYIAGINWFLWISCMSVVLIFRESANMEAAYGLSITITMMITTFLMVFYLKNKRINFIYISLFFLTYLIIESAFLYANLTKFTHGGWFTILVAGVLSFIMFSWYNGRRITNRFLRFVPLKQYTDIINDIRKDESLPKSATNLVFLTKANNATDIEYNIILSIIHRNPKRADHYWLLHVDITDDPHQMDYKVKHIINNVLTRIDFQLGFKVERRINAMFRQVISEMGKQGEVDLLSGYKSLRYHSILSDFKFYIIDRLHTSDMEFKLSEKIILQLYFFLSKISLSDARSLGLDSSTVLIEQIPLGSEGLMHYKLVRKE